MCGSSVDLLLGRYWGRGGAGTAVAFCWAQPLDGVSSFTSLKHRHERGGGVANQ